MMTLRAFSPNAQDEMHRMLHELVLNGEPAAHAPRSVSPAVDVHETETGYTLRFDLPGVNREDVRIELIENRLTVKGERKVDATAEGAVAHRLERPAGAFERAFRLRARVDANGIKARSRDGVLTIELPKAPDAVKREIPIDAG